jgi:hypothetical protein
VKDGVLHLQGGSAPPKLAYACLASQEIAPGLSVAYSWRGVPDAQGAGLAEAVFYLRFLDAQGKLIEQGNGPLRQRLGRGAFGRSWTKESHPVEPPAKAQAVELCVTFVSEGAQVQIQDWAWADDKGR